MIVINRIKVNLEAVEAMLYFWQAVNDRENLAETYIYNIAAMPSFTVAYDDEFDEESVRRALSAIKNREIFSRSNQKEGRFYNNNLWMMEDLSLTNAMVMPLKRLNLDELTKELNNKHPNTSMEELEVAFAPLHTVDYFITDNKLVINFFRVKPDLMGEDKTFIGDIEIKEYIKEKLEELLGS